MAKRTKLQAQERGSVAFDVLYEDGSRASNRRVPAELLGGLDGDAPAKQFLTEQDEAIAQKSGRDPRVISRVTRSPAVARSEVDTGKQSSERRNPSKA